MNQPSHLNCFYDLAVSPAYFDFLVFLQIAELHRVRYNFKNLRIIFVPGPKKGFRNDNLRSTESNQMMMRNVLLPSCHLLPKCDSIIYLDQRDAASEMLQNPNAIFPRNYSLQKPLNEYLESSLLYAFLRDETISYFTAPKDKHEMAQAFISHVAGNRKVITATLREAEHDSSPRRQFNIPELTKFFKTLDPNQYQPVIIRDTACTFSTDGILESYPHAPLASTDILFRTALYENSYINLFVNNGPFVCAMFSKSNSIAFKYADDNILATSHQWLQSKMGLNPGDQCPYTEKRTIIAWEDDNADIIEHYFNSMAQDIEQCVDLCLQHNIGNIEQAKIIIQIAMNRFFSTAIDHSIHQEDLLVLKRIQEINAILKQDQNWNFELKQFILEHEGKGIPKGLYGKIVKLDKEFKIGLYL